MQDIGENDVIDLENHPIGRLQRVIILLEIGKRFRLTGGRRGCATGQQGGDRDRQEKMSQSFFRHGSS
jgi:hypothetical protein